MRARILAAVATVAAVVAAVVPSPAMAVSPPPWPETCTTGAITSWSVRPDNYTLDLTGWIAPCATPTDGAAWSLVSYQFLSTATRLAFDGTSRIDFRFSPTYPRTTLYGTDLRPICVLSGPHTRLACLALSQTRKGAIVVAPLDPADPRLLTANVSWGTTEPDSTSDDGGWHCATCV